MKFILREYKSFQAMIATTRRKLPSNDVRLTTLAQPLTLTYHLQPLRGMVMTYSHAKLQGQWSVSYEDKVEMDGIPR